jgi:uncharacterized protein (DUF433 family)
MHREIVNVLRVPRTCGAAVAWQTSMNTAMLELLDMDRIDVNPAICGGKPVVRGTRIMVRNILGMVAGGYTTEKILESYPELAAEDITAALEYAARVVDEDQVIVR